MRSPTTSALPLPGAVLAPATAADAAEILVLQRCCWVAEAIENERLDIPALHETAEQVRDWIRAKPAWTVRLDGRLVGGVPARASRRSRCSPGSAAPATGGCTPAPATATCARRVHPTELPCRARS